MQLLSMTCWLSVFALLCHCPVILHAQDFKPGEVIEYKVGGSSPTRWEKGTIIRALDGGKQYLIHEKPSQFFPEGPQKAYAPTELRRPFTEKADTPALTPKGSEPMKKREPGVPAAPIVGSTTNSGTLTGNEKGLLSEEDVLQYAKKLFGAGDPFQHPNRQAILIQIREHIKAHGTSFLPTLDFDNKMHKLGALGENIMASITANYGPAPKLEQYFGTFLLRTSNRGSQSRTKEGSKNVITRTDAQYESGQLTINKDGTFVWAISRKDPEEKWVRGRWHEVKPEELNVWESGAAIWLEKARQNEDYMVRMCRVPGWLDWIDVGMGKGRTPIDYGRRP